MLSIVAASLPTPLARSTARWMFSLGIEASRAFWIAVASVGFPSGSGPPSREATVIARASLVKSLPRLASAAPFLCLIEAHFECPDIVCHSMNSSDAPGNGSTPARNEPHPRAGGELRLRRHAACRAGALDGDPGRLALGRLEGLRDPVPEPG